jgi:hypothetical protein
MPAARIAESSCGGVVRTKLRQADLGVGVQHPESTGHAMLIREGAIEERQPLDATLPRQESAHERIDAFE